MKSFKGWISATLLIGAGLLLVASAQAQDTEKRVQMKDLPPAVQKTAQEQSKGAKIRGISSEVEKGKTVYEVEMTVNGHSKDIVIDGSGAIMEIEEAVVLAKLPKAVKEGLVKAAGKGKILKVESVTKNNAIVYYEAEVKTQGKVSEIKVGTDGQSMSQSH